MTKKEVYEKYYITNPKNKKIIKILKNNYIEINIQNFCEILYEDDTYETIKIENKDPFNVNYDKGAIGFRFYDVTDIIFNNEKFIGGKNNISKFFYLGKKYNKEELDNLLFTNPSQQVLDAINIFEEKELNSIILCDCGKIIYNPLINSTTFDELKKDYKYRKNYKIKTKI